MSAKVRALEVSQYDNRNRLRSKSIPNPTWAGFLNLFKNVQGRRRSAGVVLRADDGSLLIIDGSDGLYFVLYERPGGLQFQPIDPTQPNEEVTILCGGV